MPTPPAIAASVAPMSHCVASSTASGAPGLGWFDSGSLSFELVKGLPTTLIAILVAYIAWRQFKVAEEQKRVARAKLNLDLFQRRYEVFELTWSMLSSMIQERPGHEQIEMDFNNARPRARFLFGAEIAEYMTEISRRCTDQRSIMAKRGDIMSPEDIPRHADNTVWFFDQALSGARDRFGQYLDFSEWR